MLYYFLKPTTTLNTTSSGSNANAVSPEPISQNYTLFLPAQTTATGTNGFRTGEANAFASEAYWSSTEQNATLARGQYFSMGFQSTSDDKLNQFYVRAVRRVPI